MLEHWFKERRTLVDFRRGPLGNYFDGFAAHLKKRGYSPSTGRIILSRSCLFNDWLIENRISDCRKITETHVKAFLGKYLENVRTTHRYKPYDASRQSLERLISFLVETKIIEPFPPEALPETPYSRLLAGFLQHLRDGNNLDEGTIGNHRRHICAFLKGLEKDDVGTKGVFLNPENMDTYIKEHLRTSPENLRRLSTTLRKFLRFCASSGYTSTDLSGLIPSIPSYRQASLPRGMEDSALERMLKSIPRDTMSGARDYAIMLLLMAYGIRGKSVASLLLEDIRWQSSTIRIRAQKGGKEVVLPLLDAVGEAILDYLRKRPEDIPYREVFLAIKAPFRPVNSGIISVIVNGYMKSAGVKVPHSGSSTLRHSWAIRALAHDSPIKAIADVLGHRYIDTTFIYAKADLKMLRYVAMPWPKGR